ncbi:MAG: DUF1343 domain-containing protein [Pirellulales bacterium]|nr:DUF1343 domain-containing protein [Pirellulales bacterium]
MDEGTVQESHLFSNRAFELVCLASFGLLLAGNLRLVAAAPADSPQCVLNGIDVLIRDDFQMLAGQKIGLITNHTGHDANRTSTITCLANAPNVQLVALFSPEHGLSGNLDQTEIANGQDKATGLVVHSLYGKTRQPTAEMLNGLDTIVFDIQDIGTRFYTYISTMGLAMEAASAHKKRFVVLDRVNPIGGHIVSGPVLDPGKESFVGYHPIAVRHGMTAGELARMFVAEKQLKLDLQIVKVENWDRATYFDATGLPWTNPSPNIRSLTQAILYPGIGMLETTNLSVGRGTDTPFEVIGAPWLDGRKLARALNDTHLPGVRFVPIEFKPSASKFQGQSCSGINVIVINRDHFQSVRTGLEIARHLVQMFPNDWNPESYPRLLGNQTAYQTLLAGKSVEDIEAAFKGGFDAFKHRRAKYLLY